MLVHLAKLEVPLGGNLDAPVEVWERLARRDRIGVHTITDRPDDADIVLFTQSHMLSHDWRLKALTRSPIVRQFREKVMVYDERDRPWCLFPGVYVSMPARSFNGSVQRASSYFTFPPAPISIEPDLLFSLVASDSAKCRRPLFELNHPKAVVEQTRGFTFFDPSSPNYLERRTRFEEVVARSQYVLCPRGRGTSSIRLYEVMAAGRVPVIIADDWVPPTGPEWDSFSIRWPEEKVEGLVEALERRDSDWPRMGCMARAAYEEYFAPDVLFHHVVEMCGEIYDSGAMDLHPKSGIRDRDFVSTGLEIAKERMAGLVRQGARRVVAKP